jgi:hypothetical protein
VTSRNIPFVRQQASIVGLGTDQFTKGLENILQVAIEAELAFDSNDVTSWTPAPISDELGDSIQASARYFTLAKDAPAKQVVEFNSHVDPSGVLGGMLSKRIFHCAENDVKYMNLDGGK